MIGMSDDYYTGWAIQEAGATDNTTGEGVARDTLAIGRYPGRKSFALYAVRGNEYVGHFTPLAYFRSAGAARMAGKLLDAIVKAKRLT